MQMDLFLINVILHLISLNNAANERLLYSLYSDLNNKKRKIQVRLLLHACKYPLTLCPRLHNEASILHTP
jgi:hypothetical protein